ncbi:armadillo-like helical domain-containing protein [Heterostelium album PN500]|uniref:Armadillo-like helical domain-containing protein n=1 Tax=Heterostelium pallidum (strain ATCC 26659 / Pp 5 / PN500) TaxID=670386 RepID=D3BDB8_HETP5|nr:armadillo-like helical domain-containing protein [Heterostelium album PN500]EFA80562.1 armadillo-like helical domain-containing protein [Heterostelium album PN500]|eukprot:XP_020432682.1 armadillo-like helical domain-containing protein [Heterostelium album PN500]
MSSEDSNNNNSGGGSANLSSSKGSSALGRRGTFSKAKSFRRVIGLNLEPHTSTQPQVYRFLNGEEYSGPELTQIQSPPSTPRSQRSMSVATSSPSLHVVPDDEDTKIPVFLGADGTLYNKFYVPIKIIGIDEPSPPPPKLSSLASFVPPTSKERAAAAAAATTSTTTTTSSTAFNPGDQIYTGFPEPNSYDNYFDYEQAVMDWRTQLQQSLGVIQLPQNMGRTYSRPRVVGGGRDLIRKNSEASNDDSLSFDSSERKLTESDITSQNGETDDPNGYSHSPSTLLDNKLLKHAEEDISKDGASRSRSGSDTSTGSYDGSALLDGSSPIDGSPSSGSLTSMINGTRSRSNSSTYLDHRINRSNSLSPKQSMARLNESGDFRMGRGNSILNMDEDRWTLSKDPWDSQLILQEPVPELYNTFEEYEFAMKNWAIEVIVKTPVLPPHSTQLIQLPSKEKASSTNDAASSEQSSKHQKQMQLYEQAQRDAITALKNQWKYRSGMLQIKSDDQFIYDRYITVYREQFNRIYGSGGRFFEDHELQVDKVWKRINGEPRMTLVDTVDKWYNKKQKIYRQSLSIYKGGVWANHLLMPAVANGWKESLQRKQSMLPPLPIKALRRLDINSEADGTKVELNYLSPEIPLDHTKLLPANMNIQYILNMFDTTLAQTNPFSPTVCISTEEQKQYIKTARQYDRRLVHAFRFDPHQSWTAKENSPNPNPQSQRQDIEAVMIQQPFGQTTILALINTQQIYLDRFQECFDLDPNRMYCSQLPPLVVSLNQSMGGTNNLSVSTGGGAQSNQSTGSSPNTPNQQSLASPMKQPGTPTSPHYNHLLGSPPSRSGSLSSFSFGSPASNKILLSPNNNVSILSTSSGIESPRQNLNPTLQSILVNSLGSNGSPRTGNQSSTPPSNPYIQNFINFISTNTFPEMLTIFDKVNNVLSTAKLSSLVIFSLASEKGSLLMEGIIASKDIYSLYKAALGVSYFDAVPIDLYPYPMHLNQVLIPAIAKGSTQEVIRFVFMYYYLNIIHERVQFYTSNQTVISMINLSKKDVADRLASLIQTDKELLSKIFKAIGRKSSTVSHFFLFILIQLMRIPDQTIMSFFKLKDSLLPHIRDLCHSKFLHSQFAAKRLYQILQEEAWKDFLYLEYSEKDVLITDLLSACEAGSKSLLSELVFSMCTSTLETINSNASSSVRFLLNEQLFFQIYNAITKSKKSDSNIENLAKLFAHLCKTSVRFGMVKKSENIKINKKSTTEQEIHVSPTFMFELLAFVTQPQVPSDKSLVKNYHPFALWTHRVFGEEQGAVSDAKHTEKDVKTLRDFFIERHMFIKVHMVYRKYMESNPAGRSYIQLCNLYQAIFTLTICQKLFKDSAKNSDYKEGFTKISKWFRDDSISLIR